jgi:hypothetical protein
VVFLGIALYGRSLLNKRGAGLSLAGCGYAYVSKVYLWVMGVDVNN